MSDCDANQLLILALGAIVAPWCLVFLLPVMGVMALTVVCIAGWIVWRTQGALKETTHG